MDGGRGRRRDCGSAALSGGAAMGLVDVGQIGIGVARAGGGPTVSTAAAGGVGALALLALDWVTGSYVQLAPLGFVLVAGVAGLGHRSLALLLCCALALGRLWVESDEVIPYNSSEMALNALTYLVSLVFVALLVDHLRSRQRPT